MGLSLLDRVNISTAYVVGMAEDLNMATGACRQNLIITYLID
jgi:hypothetical protein